MQYFADSTHKCTSLASYSRLVLFATMSVFTLKVCFSLWLSVVLLYVETPKHAYP